jgi:hypothetical protein
MPQAARASRGLSGVKDGTARSAELAPVARSAKWREYHPELFQSLIVSGHVITVVEMAWQCRASLGSTQNPGMIA